MQNQNTTAPHTTQQHRAHARVIHGRIIRNHNYGQVFLEEIGPEAAAAYLRLNSPQNRRLNRAAFRNYMAEMQAARWGMSPDAIVITVDGTLVNGQHRLEAIVQSGLTQTFWVWHGAPADILKYIDSHRRRTYQDRAKIAEFGMEPRAANAFNMLNKYGRYVQESGTEGGVFSYYAEHNPQLVEVANFAYNCLEQRGKGRGLYSLAVASVVARAAYHGANRTLLKRFAQVVAEQVVAENEAERSLCRALLPHLRNTVRRDGSATTTTRIYFAEVALEHFLQGKSPAQYNGVGQRERCWMLDEKPAGNVKTGPHNIIVAC